MEQVYALGSQIRQTNNKDNMLIYHQIYHQTYSNHTKYTGNSGCYSHSYLCVNLIKKNRTHVILTQFACTHRQRLTYGSCLQNVPFILVKLKHEFQFRNV